MKNFGENGNGFYSSSIITRIFDKRDRMVELVPSKKLKKNLFSPCLRQYYIIRRYLMQIVSDKMAISTVEQQKLEVGPGYQALSEHLGTCPTNTT